MNNIPLSKSLTQTKALALCKSRKAGKGEVSEKEKFEARRGLFVGFKERIHLHNIKGQSEAASAETETVSSYPEVLVNCVIIRKLSFETGAC
jgi:hypothetical protein